MIKSNNLSCGGVENLLKSQAYEITELEAIKEMTIERLRSIQAGQTDRTIINALVQYFLDETDIEEKLISVYLRRVTGFADQTIFNCFKKFNIPVSVAKVHTSEKVFNLYQTKHGTQENEPNVIIQEWEKLAIKEFGNADLLRRSINYENRNFRVTEKNKIKSTISERTEWLISNAHLSHADQLYFYCEKFGRSRNAFSNDKKRLFLAQKKHH